MKFFRSFVAVVCLCISFLTSEAQEKYSKVKVFFTTQEIKHFIINTLSLDHFNTEENSIICEIGETDIKKLIASSIQYEILIDDIVLQLQEQNENFDVNSKSNTDEFRTLMAIDVPGKTVADIIKKPAAFTIAGAMGGYYSYDEMNTAMNNLAGAYPLLVSKFSIGKSIEGRELWGVKLSDNVSADEEEAEVLFTGLQHAREAITGTSLIFFMQYLIENYATDNRIKSLVDNREIFIIPCMNPDGYEQNRKTNPAGGGMWRKNKNMTQGDGVDINRNYSVDWGVSGGGSSLPGDDTYWGTAAFSEPETKAMRDFVATRKFSAAIDQHCYGPYYSLPFGFSTRHTMSDIDKKFYSYVPALMGKYNAHRAGDSWETVGYNVAGGIKDWLLLGTEGGKGKIYGMTGEAGGGGFWAPKDQIISLSQGLCFQNIQLAFTAGPYFELQDLDEFDIINKTGTFSFSLRRVGIGNAPVIVSIIPLENIQSVGAPVSISAFPNYFDTEIKTITYTLPTSITDGQRIRFVYKTESSGIVLYDTITKFYNPVVLISDNMEGNIADNWVIGNGNARDKWGYSSTYAYGGTKALAETPSGDYGSNEQRIVTAKLNFDLSNATAAYLSFWTRHRAENGRDKLQLQVSTDNSLWIAVAGSSTIQEPGLANGSTINGEPSLTGIREIWKKEIYDLSSYKGNTMLYLRFAFTSDASNSDFAYQADDGFYIDNLKFVKTSAQLGQPTVLPVEFLHFTGKLLPDNKVQLNWQANTDEQHAYFEVERSGDGNSFMVLGKITTLAPYQFIDKQPKSGNNFYRIKQTDKDGKTAYSKIINVFIESNLKLTVFPNPVRDVLHINLGSRQAQAYKVQLTDLQGKVLYEVVKNSNSTSTEMQVDMRAWKPQLYILKILNVQNEVLETQKVMKL